MDNMMFLDEAIFEDPSIFFEENMDINHVMGLKENEGVKGGEKNTNGGESSESKKSVHKNIERQRRQEMASLCASLRSLLPFQYVKGKRATCDHMEQAVNYINAMKNKIEEMKMQRDKLKKLVDDQIPNSNIINDSVKVSRLKDNEIEMLITTNEECFHLSKVLAYLLGLGLNVTTSLSTATDQYYFHKLHIQLNEVTSIDVSELERRLINMIKAA